MRRLGLRYVFFFPRVFSLLTNEFYFDLGPHYVLKAPKELRWAVMTITGPNDASGVVWALGRRCGSASHCETLSIAVASLCNQITLSQPPIAFTCSISLCAVFPLRTSPAFIIWVS